VTTTAILIPAFKRVELLEKILSNLPVDCLARTTISLDFCPEKRSDYEKLKRIYSSAKFIFREERLGLVLNLVQSLNEIFATADSCIVLEDDILVDREVIESTTLLMTNPLPRDVFAICFFPGLNESRIMQKFTTKNIWRRSKYFSPWGWAIERDKWKFVKTIIPIESEHQYFERVVFSKMTFKESIVWLKRFQRSLRNPLDALDTQIQYAAFAQKSFFLSPVFRSADNLGFSDKLATHTQGSRPNWYRGNRCSKAIRGYNESRFLEVTLEFWDSFTVAGVRKPPGFIVKSIVKTAKKFLEERSNKLAAASSK
jgi:hypothetical protein